MKPRITLLALALSASLCGAQERHPYWTWSGPAPYHAAVVKVGGGGSGTLVYCDAGGIGLVITALHVVGNRTISSVTWANGHRSSARVIERDYQHDLATLSCRPPAGSPIAFISPYTPPPGAWIDHCGFGGPTGRLRHYWGQLESAGRTYYTRAIAINGDSGGALFWNGLLVGVLSGGRHRVRRPDIEWSLVYPVRAGGLGPIQAIVAKYPVNRRQFVSQVEEFTAAAEAPWRPPEMPVEREGEPPGGLPSLSAGPAPANGSDLQTRLQALLLQRLLDGGAPAAKPGIPQSNPTDRSLVEFVVRRLADDEQFAASVSKRIRAQGVLKEVGQAILRAAGEPVERASSSPVDRASGKAAGRAVPSAAAEVSDDRFDSEHLTRHPTIVLMQQRSSAYRRDNLPLDPSLCLAAQQHAQAMAQAGSMNHYLHGSTPWGRAGEAGWRGAGIGENIAAGQWSIGSVFQCWHNSSGHRSNMLSRRWRACGFGLSYSSRGQPYWVALYGR
jgi:hypothetical protein